MSKFNKKSGSVLLIKGLDVSSPAEYISDQACSFSKNFEVDEGLLKKAPGQTKLAEVVGGTDLEIMTGRQFTRDGNAYNVRVGLDKTEVYDSGNDELEHIDGDQAEQSDDDFGAVFNKVGLDQGSG